MGSRLKFEVRTTDFVQKASGALFSGACCCCCCLHWVGAVVGGAIGVATGFKAAQRHRRAHPSIKTAVILGLVTGLFVVGIACVVVPALCIVPALAPSVIFIPPLPCMLVAVGWKQFRARRLYAGRRRELALVTAPKVPHDQGVFRTSAITAIPQGSAPELTGYDTFCSACLQVLDDSDVLMECPSCRTSLDRPAFAAVNQGFSLSWSVGGRTFLWSTGLSILAYGAMYSWLVFSK